MRKQARNNKRARGEGYRRRQGDTPEKVSGLTRKMTHLQCVAKCMKLTRNFPTCSRFTFHNEIHNISSIYLNEIENEIKLQQRHQQSKWKTNTHNGNKVGIVKMKWINKINILYVLCLCCCLFVCLIVWMFLVCLEKIVVGSLLLWRHWYVYKILSYVVCGKRSEISIILIWTAPQQNKQSLRNTHNREGDRERMNYRILGESGDQRARIMQGKFKKKNKCKHVIIRYVFRYIYSIYM